MTPPRTLTALAALLMFLAAACTDTEEQESSSSEEAGATEVVEDPYEACPVGYWDLFLEANGGCFYGGERFREYVGVEWTGAAHHAFRWELVQSELPSAPGSCALSVVDDTDSDLFMSIDVTAPQEGGDVTGTHLFMHFGDYEACQTNFRVTGRFTPGPDAIPAAWRD